jgi:WD40 repeat protein
MGLATASWRAARFTQVSAVQFSPNGTYLAVQYESGAVQIWDVRGSRFRLAHRIVGDNPEYPSSGTLHFANENTLIDARYQADGRARRAIVRSIELPRGEVRSVVEVQGDDHLRILRSAGDTIVLVDWSENAAKFYSVRQQKIVRQYKLASRDRGVALSPDGWTLATWNRKGQPVRISIESGDAAALELDDKCTSTAFSGDNRWFASSVPDTDVHSSWIHVGSLNDEPGFSLRGVKVVPQWIAFSRDGLRLVVADPYAAETFDLSTRQRIGTVRFAAYGPNRYLSLNHPEHRRSVGDLSHFDISPRADTLVSFSGQSVLLWDTATGDLKTVLRDNSQRTQTTILIVLFSVWSAMWGIVAKRSARRERNANGHDQRETKEVSVSSAITNAPSELKLSWGLMVIGGLIALAWPIALFVSSGPLQWPMMYVSLFTGMAAMAKGAGRQTTGLLWMTKAQQANMFACDWINFVLGTLEFALLNRQHVQQYLALANDLARPLR